MKITVRKGTAAPNRPTASADRSGEAPGRTREDEERCFTRPPTVDPNDRSGLLTDGATLH